MKKDRCLSLSFFLFPEYLSGGASTVMVGLRLSLSAFEGNARFFE
ncbi:hypothetical protein [Peribacillus frigoritolerans]|nr:hypothetical protein [Peribacillus frigoritolerans]MED3832851.1 hypothetical protein [Peribacillus frigoritolerans]MED3846572.1 hypothetical protein [Peribacillus frigoritolerans]